jgi:hypothetical protein
MDAEIYKTDGTVEFVAPANKKNFTLKEMQEIVGGYIEIIFIDADSVMVINEMGNPAKITDPRAKWYIKNTVKQVGNLMHCRHKN